MFQYVPAAELGCTCWKKKKNYNANKKIAFPVGYLLSFFFFILLLPLFFFYTCIYEYEIRWIELVIARERIVK